MQAFLRRLGELLARFPRRARSTVGEARQSFLIGGRKYEVIRASTAEHDFWVMSRIHVAGLARIEMQASEDPEEFARRVLESLLEGGQIFSILAGLIVPHGCAWSIDVARDTEWHLRRARAPGDKATIRALVSTLLADFFASGAISAVTSRTSSPLPREMAATPSSAAAASPGVSGPPLFEISEAPTPNAGGL